MTDAEPSQELRILAAKLNRHLDDPILPVLQENAKLADQVDRWTHSIIDTMELVKLLAQQLQTEKTNSAELSNLLVKLEQQLSLLNKQTKPFKPTSNPSTKNTQIGKEHFLKLEASIDRCRELILSLRKNQTNTNANSQVIIWLSVFQFSAFLCFSFFAYQGYKYLAQRSEWSLIKLNNIEKKLESFK
jgi:hypothetical protein